MSVMETRPLSPRASPLPSSAKSPAGGGGGGGGGGFQWLFGKRGRRNRARQPLAAQLGPGDDDGEEVEDEEDFFFVSTPYLSTPSWSAAAAAAGASPRKRGDHQAALARLRAAVLSVLARARRGGRRAGGGSSASARVLTGTVFGRLRGRVHLALQTDPRAAPAMMLELAGYSTGALVREMASGLVRLALECEKAAPPTNPGTYTNSSCSHPPMVFVLCSRTHRSIIRRREAAAGGADGGDDVAGVLQRAQVRVRGAPRVRRRGVARAARRRAGHRRRRRAPRRWRRCRRRGGHDVHESEVREGGGVEGLGGVLHGQPRRQRRPGAQHLPPQSLIDRASHPLFMAPRARATRIDDESVNYV
ncbi:Os06g0495800 [Oryza sativa Japonica Group]|uniref:Os06g0495800 protein n=2 Tax=Oryza sativa subsp. japonica TaxID=39947 RepID=Q0DC17_ORYSJ|nr:hypothetical protein EE612_034329 [Oryza sativa]BAF19606.2 Os06g0495800 [Oryza sativa Japonica Group]BAS97893.1 Os06g0495800 [Oryza sativa Japonica Group]|eukprot:NP_001057692.2 Os06g0495800 [Oryza sativa Japonica Group]